MNSIVCLYVHSRQHEYDHKKMKFRSSKLKRKGDAVLKRKKNVSNEIFLGSSSTA